MKRKMKMKMKMREVSMWKLENINNAARGTRLKMTHLAFILRCTRLIFPEMILNCLHVIHIDQQHLALVIGHFLRCCCFVSMFSPASWASPSPPRAVHRANV